MSHFLEKKLRQEGLSSERLSPERLRGLTKVTKLIRIELNLKPRPMSLHLLISQKRINDSHVSLGVVRHS